MLDTFHTSALAQHRTCWGNTESYITKLLFESNFIFKPFSISFQLFTLPLYLTVV